MKKLITFLSILTTVAIFALPVAARNAVAQPDNSVQDQCTTEAKDALYASFLKNRQADQAKAFEDAKKYLACPATGQVTEAQQKIIDYLKKWSTTYEKEFRKVQLPILLYNEKKYPEAYALGKQILADEPDNLYVLVHLGANGYLVTPLKNAALTADAVAYARKGLQLLEAGQNLEKWEPLANRDVALAYLNYTIGSLTLEADAVAALKHLLKAAQYETPLKKSAYTYAYIAGAYETGSYLKLSDEYNRVYKGKDETPESKLALANINQLVDRMIDAYARAVALAAADPNFATAKAAWQDSLTNLYKYRNGSETGLPELIAGILTKPLPPEPTPLTQLPASAPAAAPAATPAANNAGTNGAATTATPTGTAGTKPASTTPGTAGTKPASTTPTTPAPGTKPAPGKPDKPRQRR